MNSVVKLIECQNYDSDGIYQLLMENHKLFEMNIEPGDKIVIKPNWIAPAHKYNKEEWLSVITHPTVITAVLRLVLNCLQGKGQVIIADAPQTDSSWIKIMKLMNPERWILMGNHSGVNVQILDLRDDEWTEKDGIIIQRKKLQGDPKGSTECDLANSSEFVEHKKSKRGYYGADYDKEETNQAHENGNHLYKVSRSIIEADVFINIPKMKTHKKTGITCSLKNLVGINTYKNYLPHYSIGTPAECGDQYPLSTNKNKIETRFIQKYKKYLLEHKGNKSIFSLLLRLGKKIFGDSRYSIRSGNWYGNDTIWRMVLDLNKVLFYANATGTIRDASIVSKKKYISVVDGIVSGEGEGPEAPNQKFVGILLLGDNPLSVDAVCAKIMGFDWRKIPIIKNAFLVKNYPLGTFSYNDIIVESKNPVYNKKLEQISLQNLFYFKPPRGWIGHIELKND